MKSNISSVLLLSAVGLWITLCDAVSHKDGNYLKSHILEQGNSTHNKRQNGHLVFSGSRNGSRIWFEKALQLSKNARKIDTKNGHFVSDGLWNVITGREKHSPLMRSDEEEYGGTIFTNKDFVTRTQEKSIPPLQFTGTSGHRNVKDLTFLYARDSVRDTYRNRYHDTKAKNAPKPVWSSSVSRKSFDGLSGHYKSWGSGRAVDEKTGLSIDNETHHYNYVPGTHSHNFISKSRKKRSDKDSISRGQNKPETESDLGDSTVSGSHSDQMSWPDESSRMDNKITSSPFVNTNSVLPTVNTNTDVPDTTGSNVKSTTTSLPDEVFFNKTSSTKSPSLVIPKSTIKTIPMKTDLTSLSTSLKDDATESHSFPQTFAQTSQSHDVKRSSDETSTSSQYTTHGVTEPSNEGITVTETGTTSTLTGNSNPVTSASQLQDTSTSTTVSHAPSIPSHQMTDPITNENTHHTEKTNSITPIPLYHQVNSTVKGETSSQVTEESTPEPTPEPESSEVQSTMPTQEPSTMFMIPMTVQTSSKQISEMLPVEISATSLAPKAESSQEPTTEVSPEPLTTVNSSKQATEFSILLSTTNTYPNPTAAKLSKHTFMASTEPVTLSSGQLTINTSPEPTEVQSSETSTFQSSISTIKTLPAANTTLKNETQTSPEPTAEPKVSAEPSLTFKTDIPVIFIPEADEVPADEITKISDGSNSSNATIHSKETISPEPSSNTTELSSVESSGRTTPLSVTSKVSPTNEILPPPTSEPHPTPIGETSPTSTYEPQPESSKPEPEGATESTPDSTPIAVAEPGPDWKDAKKKWNIAWEIHLYMLGCIFAAVAFYTLMSMVRLYQINRLLSKKYFVTLNLLICLLCSLRAVFLLVDGYNSNGTFHPVVNYLLYSTAFPCLTSAFSILLYALLQATQMRLVPPRVQKIQILIVIIFFHFVLQMTTDILVGMYAGMSIMLFVCQMVFICWGLFLFFGYAYIFRYLYTSAVKRQKNYQYMLTGKLYPSSGESYKHKFTLSLAVKVTFMAAILGLVTIGLEIYAIVGVYGVFSDKKPEAWPWWLYHTALRLVECLMCIIMAYVASQPFRYREMRTCGFMCAPCLEICQCGGKDEQSNKLGWSEYDRLYMTTNKRSNGHTNGKKKKIYLNEGTDIVPIVIQPSTTEESRPPSMLIIEDGYVRFQAETDINKIVDNFSKTHPETEMSTFKNYDGIVNDAYIRSMEDTVRFQDDIASSDGITRKSRKSSLASSGFFRPPSSISLADSMESEIDKAFRSMRQNSASRLRASSHSLPSRSTYSMDDNFQGTAIEAYIEQVSTQPGVSLRRSRSALGDLNIHRPESWHQKLFRSRSDSTGGVRTKDLDSMRYLSLLDLEKQQDKNVTFASEIAMSKDLKNSDDSLISSEQSVEAPTSSGDVVKRLLQKEISEPEEIDV